MLTNQGRARQVSQSIRVMRTLSWVSLTRSQEGISNQYRLEDTSKEVRVAKVVRESRVLKELLVTRVTEEEVASPEVLAAVFTIEEEEAEAEAEEISTMVHPEIR